HVEMSAAGDPLQSHAVVDTIERDFLRERGLNLVVHMDPVADVDTAAGRFREWIAGQARTVDPALTIHDLCVIPGGPEGRTAFNFDCAAPADLALSDDEIRRRLADKVAERYPRCRCDITVDRGYAAMPHPEPPRG